MLHHGAGGGLRGIGQSQVASAPASTCSADDDEDNFSNAEDEDGRQSSVDLNGLAETLVDSDDEEAYDEVSPKLISLVWIFFKRKICV